MFKALCSFAIIGSALILTGCKSTPAGYYKPYKPIDNAAAFKPVDDPNKPTSVIEQDGPFKPQNIPLLEENELGKKVSHPFENKRIYFATDRAVIGSAYDQTIEALAAYLKNNPTYILKIGGHCDERGSEEYNTSLSEKRAISVKDALVKNGVDSKRVTTVSYGESMPVVKGIDGKSYAKNRRAEFEVYDPTP